MIFLNTLNEPPSWSAQSFSQISSGGRLHFSSEVVHFVVIVESVMGKSIYIVHIYHWKFQLLFKPTAVFRARKRLLYIWTYDVSPTLTNTAFYSYLV